jgi:Ca2+/Na+ antiporter
VRYPHSNSERDHHTTLTRLLPDGHCPHFVLCGRRAGHPSPNPNSDLLHSHLPFVAGATLLYLLTFPIAAPIHLTTPDARRPSLAAYYPLTLAVSLFWLIVLATLMTLALDGIGCLIGFSSTVMGLTLGAVGTSFPNLCASRLSLRLSLEPSPQPHSPSVPPFACLALASSP